MHTLQQPCYLYIVSENDFYYRDGKYGFAECPDGNTKIGVCSSKLWERLRKLQQGNYRELLMPHLWLGEYNDVLAVEKIVKDEWASSREWTHYQSSDLYDKVTSLPILQEKLVYIRPKYGRPYSAVTQKQCRFTDVSPSWVYNAAKVAPPETDYSIASDGSVYLTDPCTRIWP